MMMMLMIKTKLFYDSLVCVVYDPLDCDNIQFHSMNTTNFTD